MRGSLSPDTLDSLGLSRGGTRTYKLVKTLKLSGELTTFVVLTTFLKKHKVYRRRVLAVAPLSGSQFHSPRQLEYLHLSLHLPLLSTPTYAHCPCTYTNSFRIPPCSPIDISTSIFPCQTPAGVHTSVWVCFGQTLARQRFKRGLEGVMYEAGVAWPFPKHVNGW